MLFFFQVLHARSVATIGNHGVVLKKTISLSVSPDVALVKVWRYVSLCRGLFYRSIYNYTCVSMCVCVRVSKIGHLFALYSNSRVFFFYFCRFRTYFFFFFLVDRPLAPFIPFFLFLFSILFVFSSSHP